MSSVGKSRGRPKKKATSAPKARATGGIVKSLTGDQIAALEEVTGGTISKGEKTDISKDGATTSVDTYQITIEVSKTINANSLVKAANSAVEALGVASKAELAKIAEKVSSEAEKATITKALKVLDSVVQPAKAASIKI
jgi:hypothetical protein